VAPSPVGNIETVLGILNSFPPPTRPEIPPHKPPVPFDPCAPPSQTLGPTFLIPFRRPLFHPALTTTIDLGSDTQINGGLPALRFNCTILTGAALSLALDLHFNQEWNLLQLAIGDLSSTISLAPSEQLTLEFQTSQRRVLEQTRVDSAEEMNSTESTTVDKEVLNTVQSASKTSNWHVDGSAQYSNSGFTASVQSGYSESTTHAAQTTIDHLSESTKKAAHNLKTLHKIEVRGVSERFVSNRMTRIIKNPYLDRTLSLNVFQLLKLFSVQTELVELRPALIIDVKGLLFNRDFVAANTDFLVKSLLDPALIDDLPNALIGTNPLPARDLEQARAAAKSALHYLYDEPNIFDLPDNLSQDKNVVVLDFAAGGAEVLSGPNLPVVSIDGGRHYGTPNPPIEGGLGQRSGFAAALRSQMGAAFAYLVFFQKVYRDMASNAQILNENAIKLAGALADRVGPLWTKLEGDPQRDTNLKDVLNNDSLNEVMRRTPGFLAMMSGMVGPLGGTTPEEVKAIQEREAAELSLQRLLQHLQCNENYYTQVFLAYRAEETGNQAVVDFVDDVLNRFAHGTSNAGTVRDVINSWFDVRRPFIDKQQMVIPGLNALDASEVSAVGSELGSPSDFNLADIQPVVLPNVQLPADGIHLEVAEGACVLKDAPVPPCKVDFSLQGATLSITGEEEGKRKRAAIHSGVPG
jgi:hypothetical protein